MSLNSKKKITKANRGITLIALVITIIVLLILAGVTIVTLTGDNGLLSKASNAKQTTKDAEIEEEVRLAWNSVYPDSYLNNYDLATKASKLKEALDKNGSTSTVTPEEGKLKVNYKNKDFILDPTTGSLKKSLPEVTAGQKAPNDSNAQYKSGDYTAIIPAGFTVSNKPGETSIETGLVIRDNPENGNEFVWIPVGIPWKTDSSKTITLARYAFKISDDETSGTIRQTKTDGSELRQVSLVGGQKHAYNCIEEGTRETETKNAVAKDINDFIAKTNAAGGFWIGRYEARTTSQTAISSDPLTSVTEKPEYAVYNYITQPDASAKARTMYTSDYFESDLVNSYAWDTATLFLQEYDNRTDAVKGNSNYKAKYSNQIRLSSGIKNTGTNNLSAEANKDKICNVYDMADNCWEWTTETSSYGGAPCVLRGGSCNHSSYYTSYRNCNFTAYANADNSFRPVLYIK